MLSKTTTAALAALTLAAAAPAGANAATTLGSPLQVDGAQRSACTGAGDAIQEPCTVMQASLSGATLVVPHDGVITRWNTVESTGSLRVVAIRGPQGSRFVVGGSQAAQGNGTQQSFPTRFSVRAGDRIGIEMGADARLGFQWHDENTTVEEWHPQLGSTPRNHDAGESFGYELLFNAVLEPDADGNGFGDETQETTDPGTTDPGTTDPGTTDPGTTDPGVIVDPVDGLAQVILDTIDDVELHGRYLVTEVTCPSAEACEGGIAISHGGRLLGGAMFSAPAGETVAVKIKVKRSAARKLRRQDPAELTATIKSADDGTSAQDEVDFDN